MGKTLSRNIDYFLADRLAVLREAKGLSRAQLATLTDMDAREIYRLEHAQTAMSAHDIAKFAKHLGVLANDLYSGFEPSPEDAAMLKPVLSSLPNEGVYELVQNYLSISQTDLRHALGAAARQASRHY